MTERSADGQFDDGNESTDNRFHSVRMRVGVGALGGIGLFLLGYWSATIAYSVLQRPGIPIGPFLWIPVAALATGIATAIEKRVQTSRQWERIEGAWYWLVVLVPAVPPIVLAVVAPLPVLTELPPGAAFLFAAALIAAPVAAAILRGKWKRRHSEETL